jgi:nitrite reductase (NADH) small subunit
MSSKDDSTPLVQLVPTGYGQEDPAICHAFKFVEAAQPPVSRSGQRLVVCHRDELKPGERRIVDDGKHGIGVFNIEGRFYAIKNVCPHAGAELCRGTVHATHAPSDVAEFIPALHGRVLRCPWHGWEFDIPSGKGLYDRNGRVATYVVEVDEQGNVVVVL